MGEPKRLSADREAQIRDRVEDGLTRAHLPDGFDHKVDAERIRFWRSASIALLDEIDALRKDAALLVSRAAEAERARADVARLRRIISRTAAELGGGISEQHCSIDFMEQLPEEARLVVSGTRARIVAWLRDKAAKPWPKPPPGTLVFSPKPCDVALFLANALEKETP